MSVRNQIETIISKRKENLPKIDRVLADIQNCKDAVYKLEEFQNTYSKDDDFGMALKKIDTEKFNKACRLYTDRLKSLKSRLDRNELHISFVGRAGQGKSFVMQKISGLGDDFIPSAKGSDCTGAKSIITNSSNAKVEAEIQFFSQLEIVNIVNTYLRSIFADTVESVNSIDDIKKLSKSTLESKIPTASSSAQEQFKHLVKYIEHIGEVEKQLGSKIIISSNEIESYVAQYNHLDNSEKYYKYIGVKEANIKCKFPCSDAGKIVLVDTIGIGATSLGVVESMNETIKNDSDAIVLMFRPEELRPRISSDEIEIIDNISKLVSEEYSRLMLFWVINKVSGKGDAYNHSIEEIVDSINKRNHPISETLLVDCADESEVNTKLLLPVLGQLSEKILDADKILIESVKDDEDKCREEWTKLSDAISDLLLLNGSDDFKKILSIKVQDTFDKGVLNDIRTLTFKDLGDIKDKSCDKFESEIAERLKDIFWEIPKEDSIRDYAKMGTKEAMDVWNHFAALFRNKIIDDFYKVDSKLDEIVNEMKLKVIEILASPNKGCLCNLVPFNENGCANEWISEIEKYINEIDYPHLYAALEKFKSFTIKTDGFVISKVRIALEPIDPKYIDKNKKIKKYVPTLTHTLSGEEEQVALAEEIVGYFNQYASDIKRKIAEEMKKLYSIPNESMWAAVYDLYDRLAFAKEDGNQYFGIKEEWKTLYEKNFNKIFQSEYEKLSNMQGLSTEWKRIVNTIKNLSKNEFLKSECKRKKMNTAKIAGKGLSIVWNGMKTVTNKAGEITDIVLQSANTLPVNILMVGGKRCGKTSLLAAINKESASFTSKGDLVISPNDPTLDNTLNEKIAEFNECFKHKQLYIPDGTPTSEPEQYTINARIKNKNGTIAMNFLDVPGEWFNPKSPEFKDHQEKMQLYINTSNILLISIDTPHLMEESGDFNDAKNNAQNINWFIRNCINFAEDKKGNIKNNRMILFVPMKCEKYLKEGRMNEVNLKIKEVYKTSIDFLTTGSNDGKCVVAITPVFTLIGAEFAYFGRNDNQEIEKNGYGVPAKPLYRFDASKEKAEFQDCEQPLLYILMFMLENARRIKDMKKIPVLSFFYKVGELFFKMPSAGDFMAQQDLLKSSIKRNGDGYEIIQNPMDI